MASQARSSWLVNLPQYKWILNLESSDDTGVGVSDNNQHEYTSSSKNNEDRYFSGTNHGMELCVVLDGHDGEKAADFARLLIPGKLLSEKIIGGSEAVCNKISKAFRDTETDYFVALGDALMRKLSLQSEINARARNSYEAQRMFPKQVHEITRLNDQIKGGTTVVLSLIVNNYLYIANVGDSRAILCMYKNGELVPVQLSDDHTVYNPGEQDRLAALGLNVELLRAGGRLGPYQVTRSIGDHDIKGGYKEIDTLSCASKEPGICDPFINGAWPVDDLRRSNSFLLLMSDGLYGAYGTYINSANPQEVHKGIASIIVEEMKTRSTVHEVAQATVDKVVRLHRSCTGTGARLDDITLIIHNFGHPLRERDHIDGTNRQSSSVNYTSNSGGEFIPEDVDTHPQWKNPQSDKELISQMERVNISQGGPSTSDVEYPPPVELTEEEKKSGKVIAPYILFPLSFPYKKNLDDF